MAAGLLLLSEVCLEPAPHLDHGLGEYSIEGGPCTSFLKLPFSFHLPAAIQIKSTPKLAHGLGFEEVGCPKSRVMTD